LVAPHDTILYIGVLFSLILMPYSSVWNKRAGLDFMRVFKKLKIHRPRVRGRDLRDILFILVGAFIMAAGIGIFLVDAKVVPGGVSGLSMTVHYLSGNKLPVGLVMWMFNIPLYVWGIRELGKQFGFRTFLGFTSNSFFIDLLRGQIPGLSSIHLHDHPSLVAMRQDDFLLMVLVGGVLLGVGLGIIFKFKGSTAGSDILAAVARKRWGIKPGTSFMVADFCVIMTAGAVIHFKHLSFDRPVLTLVLYAVLILYISSRIVDVIIEGFDYARSAYIISDKNEVISRVIIEELSRGATAFKAKGLYKNQDKEVLYTVLSRKEIGLLTDKVKAIDPNAFIIVQNVHEVLGEGFRPRI
jgi:uncharacterized membrane-anchored protein YitT (DUF2179 family)